MVHSGSFKEETMNDSCKAKCYTMASLNVSDQCISFRQFNCHGKKTNNDKKQNTLFYDNILFVIFWSYRDRVGVHVVYRACVRLNEYRMVDCKHFLLKAPQSFTCIAFLYTVHAYKIWQVHKTHCACPNWEWIMNNKNLC